MWFEMIRLYRGRGGSSYDRYGLPCQGDYLYRISGSPAAAGRQPDLSECRLL